MINIEDFNSIVIPALQDVLNKSWAKAPQTKRVAQYSGSIDCMTFEQLSQYVKENNIPAQAFITIGDDEYTVFVWEITVETTAEEKENAIKRWFNTSVSFKPVYEALTKIGYIRTGANSSLFKEFRDTTVYDMFVSREFDRLHKYYSLFFEKK